MKVMLFVLLIEAMLSSFFKTVIDPEYLVFVYLLINTVVLIIWFNVKAEGDKWLFAILVGGLYLRLGALVYDINIARLPFNTTDAQRFHELAVETANALPDVLLEHFTGFYSQVLGVIYYIFGPYLYWGHFFNILFVMLAATKLLDIAKLMNLNLINKRIMIAIWLFAPIPFLMGYALLREASMYYFVVLSIYHFLKWFEKYNILHMIIAIIAVYIGSRYHEGLVVIAVPYLYAFIFYDRHKNKIKMNGLNIACITTAFILFLAFIGSEAGQEYIQKTNAETGGGSAYLTNLKVETPIEFLFAGPIKAFFLVYSPMPWLVRNPMDIITLLLDSSLWIYTTYLFVKNYKTIDSRYKLLMLCIILGGFVYGMGTLNTGTAIRHRNKLMAFTLVLMMAIKNKVDLDYEKREVIE